MVHGRGLRVALQIWAAAHPLTADRRVMINKTNLRVTWRVKGQYFDAIHVKKNRVVPMIIEAQGGITPHTRAAIGHHKVLSRVAARQRQRGARLDKIRALGRSPNG